MGEKEACKSPSLLSSLWEFRYTSQQPHKMPHHVTPEPAKTESKSESPLKLNTDMFKRLHDDSKPDNSAPPAKREKFAFYNGGEKVQEALKFLKKIYPLMDIMDIQDALVQSDYNVDLAVKALNKVIISKIDVKPKPVTTVATMTSTAVSTDKEWKRIRNGPPQFKFAKAASAPSSPTVKHTATSTVNHTSPTVKHTATSTVNHTSPTVKHTATSTVNHTSPTVKHTATSNPSSPAKHSPTMSPKPASVATKSLDYYNPRAKKQSVLEFLSSASLAELVSVPRVTYTKANIIIRARPFGEWHVFCKKVEKNGLAAVESLYENVAEVLRVRSEVSSLMRTCSELSQSLDLRVRQIKSQGKDSELVLQPTSLSPGLKLTGYQMVGLTWLRLLFVQGVNGILADEMGLGKTIQVIAFLAYLKEQGLQKGVHLIVVPSSTLENWMNEFRVWCPALKVQCYYGSHKKRRKLRYWWRDDKKVAEVAQVDILLTTYNLVNSTKDDKDFFRKLDLQYIVYDEAHMLKNMATQCYQALMRIGGQHRILLTGTPLRNHLIEVMSLMIFVMPDIFADKQNDLKALFKSSKAGFQRCEFEKDKIRQAKRIMEPFLLRRLKKDVLGELPPKTEVVEYCEMSIKQAGYYHALLREFQDAEAEIEDIEDPLDIPLAPLDAAEEEEEFELELDEEDKDEASAKEEPGGGLTGSMAKMMLLRRAANHPALLRVHFTDKIIEAMALKLKRDRTFRENNLENIEIMLHNMSDHQLNRLCMSHTCVSRHSITNDYLLDSGKINKLDDILPELKEAGHRVLIFSQFRQAVDVLDDYMRVRQHKCLKLDGTTPVAERQSLIDKFNSDKSIFAFLLTTKAGGCGINLASADTVIIFDIDLNPYNDKQAEDRCHRVGQKKPVTVIRFISKHTIEEAMLKIACSKLLLERQITHGVKRKELDQRLLRRLREAVKTRC